ncbi:MAG TPA: hypothetical protein VJ716_03510 [Gaiellaceae bacterium]|nr:hypothetical protein [Gaiellaceae bacterium]
MAEWYVRNVADNAWGVNEKFGAESFLVPHGGPCAMVTVGARGDEHSILYPRGETALAHGAGVEEETDSVDEAYAPFPEWDSRRPAAWDSLPWSRAG